MYYLKVFTGVLICFLALAQQVGRSQELPYVQGELLVQLPAGMDAGHLVNDLDEGSSRGAGLSVVRGVSIPLGLWLLQFDYAQVHEKQLLEAVLAHPDVVAAHWNFWLQPRLSVVPDDELFFQQWHLYNDGSAGGLPDADIDAELAWSITTGGVSVLGDTIVACVLDDGLDNSHEDFGPNRWYNYGEVPGNGLDDDGNGYVDDFDGWNAAMQTDDVEGGEHGTPVAGLLGARGNNALGVSGVNWGVKLMLVAGIGTTADLVEAYTYPYTMRMRYNESEGAEGAFVVVANTSFGIDFGQPSDFPWWCDLYDLLGSAGILHAAATINGHYDVDVVGDLPTACPSDFMLAVTSTTKWDEKAANAGYGATHIDLGAPGAEVWTTLAGNTYGVVGGTSVATPLVAGAVAAIYAVPCPSLPYMAKQDAAGMALLARTYILDGVDALGSLQGITATGGRLNLANTLQLALDGCDASGCYPPYAVSVYNVQDTAVSFNWALSNGVIQVHLLYREVGDSSWQTVPNVSSPYTLFGLAGCTGYEFQLQAVCDVGTEVAGNIQSFYTEGCCKVPTALSASVLSGEEVVASWANVWAAESYVIRYRPAGASVPWITVSVVDTVFIIQGLLPCQAYEWQVQTQCSGGVLTEFTHLDLFTTFGCAPCLEYPYCEVVGLDATDAWISQVLLHEIEQASGNEYGGYSDFTAQSAHLFKGASYVFSLSAGYTFFFPDMLATVWIDYNQNGLFDEPEDKVHQALIDSSGIQCTLTIPDIASTGSTRMRITLKNDTTGPCGPSNALGETEDYCLYIADLDECIPPLLMSCTPSAESVDISWIGTLQEDAYHIQYRIVGSSAWHTQMVNTSQITLQGLAPCASYVYQIRSICDGEGGNFTPFNYFDTQGCGPCLDQEYCTTGGDNAHEWIDSISIHTASHYSGQNEVYQLYTQLPITLIPGESYPISLVPGYANTTYEEHFSLWIDYNQDGQFDVNELAFQTENPVEGSAALGFIHLPVDIPIGNTRLRIIMQYQQLPNTPCLDEFSGEVEDYCINIGEAACAYPNSSYLDILSDTTVQINWPIIPSAVSYRIHYRLLNSGEPWKSSLTPDNTHILADLLPCAFYEYTLQTICSASLSPHSAPAIFEACDDPPMQSEGITSKDGLSLYPNPFNSELIIQLPTSTPKIWNVKLLSIQGITLSTTTLYSQPDNLPTRLLIPELPAGLYLLQFQHGQTTITKKVMRQ